MRAVQPCSDPCDIRAPRSPRLHLPRCNAQRLPSHFATLPSLRRETPQSGDAYLFLPARDGRGALRHARTQALGTPDLAMGLRCTKDQHPSRESQSQPVRTTCALEGALQAERMRRAARLHTAWTCSDACVRHAPSRAEALAAVALFLHLPVHRTVLGLRASVMHGRGQHSRVEACESVAEENLEI